jgi:hypothetical protein
VTQRYRVSNAPPSRVPISTASTERATLGEANDAIDAAPEVGRHLHHELQRPNVTTPDPRASRPRAVDGDPEDVVGVKIARIASKSRAFHAAAAAQGAAQARAHPAASPRAKQLVELVVGGVEVGGLEEHDHAACGRRPTSSTLRWSISSAPPPPATSHSKKSRCQHQTLAAGRDRREGPAGRSVTSKRTRELLQDDLSRKLHLQEGRRIVEAAISGR